MMTVARVKTTVYIHCWKYQTGNCIIAGIFDPLTAVAIKRGITAKGKLEYFPT
jgi:hypothetical protein